VKKTLAIISALLAFGLTACNRLNTPEKKAGYAVGLRIGQDLKQIQEKVDINETYKGLQEAVAGKSSMDENAVREALMTLGPQGSPDKVKAGYAVGASIARSLKPIQALVDLNSVIKGIKDQLAGKPKMESADQEAALKAMSERQMELRGKQGEENKKAGQAYLDANKAKAGVKVTASGLQYEVLKAGAGAKPKASSTVKVHYTGTLITGEKFDSSVDRGQPAEFPLSGVIRGWTEGLQLMNVGSKFRFVIPSDLAYGPQGQGPQIGPDSVLVFEVELLAITKR